MLTINPSNKKSCYVVMNREEKSILGLLDSVVIKPMFCKLSQICVNISPGLQWAGLAKFLGHFLLLAMCLRFGITSKILLLQARVEFVGFLEYTPQD